MWLQIDPLVQGALHFLYLRIPGASFAKNWFKSNAKICKLTTVDTCTVHVCSSGYVHVRTPILTPKRKIIGWRVFRHLYIVGTGTRASDQHVDRFCGKCCLKMCVQVFKIYSAYRRRRLFTQNSINRCSVPQQLYQYILGKVFYRVRVMHDT